MPPTDDEQKRAVDELRSHVATINGDWDHPFPDDYKNEGLEWMGRRLVAAAPALLQKIDSLEAELNRLRLKRESQLPDRADSDYDPHQH